MGARKVSPTPSATQTPKATGDLADIEYLMRITLALTDPETGRTWALPAGRLGFAFYQLAGGARADRRARMIDHTTERLMLALCRATLEPEKIDAALDGLTTAPAMPAGVPFPLAHAEVSWDKGAAGHTVPGARLATALAYLYRTPRGGGWDSADVVGAIIEGLGLAAELIAEQHGALALWPEDLERIQTALGGAIADYAARLLASSRAEAMGLGDAMVTLRPKGVA